MSSTPKQSITIMTEEEANALMAKATQRFDEGGNETGGVSQSVAAVFNQITIATGGATLRLGGQANAGMRQSRVLHMILLVDASGSMDDDRAQVVDGLNDFVAEMAKPSNPERNAIEVTVWLFANRTASIMTVADPDYDPKLPTSSTNQPRMELINMPVVLIPTITMADYQPGGGTPLYKTVIAAFASGSYRNEKLAQGVFNATTKTWTNRVATQSFAIVITDGDDTLSSENIGGQTMNYTSQLVQQVAAELHRTEMWSTAVIAAGSSSTAEAMKNEMGFMFGFDIGSHDIRTAFGMASVVAQTASQAAVGGGSVSQNAGQIQNAGNTFLKKVKKNP